MSGLGLILVWALLIVLAVRVSGASEARADFLSRAERVDDDIERDRAHLRCMLDAYDAERFSAELSVEQGRP